MKFLKVWLGRRLAQCSKSPKIWLGAGGLGGPGPKFRWVTGWPRPKISLGAGWPTQNPGAPDWVDFSNTGQASLISYLSSRSFRSGPAQLSSAQENFSSVKLSSTKILQIYNSAIRSVNFPETYIPGPKLEINPQNTINYTFFSEYFFGKIFPKSEKSGQEGCSLSVIMF